MDPDEAQEDIEAFAEDTVETAQDAAVATVEAADNLLQGLNDAPENEAIRVLMVVGGAILLLAGWRVYDYLVVLAGIFIGATLAVSIVNDTNTVVQIAALLVGGLIGAVIGVFLYYVAVLLIGAYVGLALTEAVLTLLNVTPISPIILLIGAVIGAILLLSLSSELLIVFSALIGAQLLAAALVLDPLWVLILAIVGIIIQVGAARATGVSIRRRPRPVFRSRRT